MRAVIILSIEMLLEAEEVSALTPIKGKMQGKLISKKMTYQIHITTETIKE